MTNKYLEKIAGSVLKTHKVRDALDYLGFGMGATGLALGASRTANSDKAAKVSAQKTDLEAKSLRVLNSIDRKLSGQDSTHG